MKPNRFLLIITILAAFGPSLRASSLPDTSLVRSLIVEGDALVDRFENELALRNYLEALRDDSSNVEILWRISRAYIDIGEHLPVGTEPEEAKQLETYEIALQYAEKAVRADHGSSMAFTRRSIANGRIALFRGIWESLSLVKQTRADVETALALDPENDVANYILGRVHAKVTEKPRILRWPLGLGWANTEDAIKYFEKAISLKQEFIMYRLDCARAYADDDNYEMARKHLEAIDRIGNKDEDDERFRKEAAELLEEIREQ
jgi:tetratricopeptide (TPR) repeat protein